MKISRHRFVSGGPALLRAAVLCFIVCATASACARAGDATPPAPAPAPNTEEQSWLGELLTEGKNDFADGDGKVVLFKEGSIKVPSGDIEKKWTDKSVEYELPERQVDFYRTPRLPTSSPSKPEAETESTSESKLKVKSKMTWMEAKREDSTELKTWGEKDVTSTSADGKTTTTSSDTLSVGKTTVTSTVDLSTSVEYDNSKAPDKRWGGEFGAVSGKLETESSLLTQEVSDKTVTQNDDKSTTTTETSGSASLGVLNTETTSTISYGKDGLKGKLGTEAQVAAGQLEGSASKEREFDNGVKAEGSADGTLSLGSLKGGASFEVTDDEIKLEAEAHAALVHAEGSAEGRVGNDYVGVEGKLEVEGLVGAEASGEIGASREKGEVTLKGEAQVGASVEAKGQAAFEIFGIKIGVQGEAEGIAGAAIGGEVTAKAGEGQLSLTVSAKAAVGLGGGLSGGLYIDVSSNKIYQWLFGKDDDDEPDPNDAAQKAVDNQLPDRDQATAISDLAADNTDLSPLPSGGELTDDTQKAIDKLVKGQSDADDLAMAPTAPNPDGFPHSGAPDGFSSVDDTPAAGVWQECADCLNNDPIDVIHISDAANDVVDGDSDVTDNREPDGKTSGDPVDGTGGEGGGEDLNTGSPNADGTDNPGTSDGQDPEPGQHLPEIESEPGEDDPGTGKIPGDTPSTPGEPTATIPKDAQPVGEELIDIATDQPNGLGSPGNSTGTNPGKGTPAHPSTPGGTNTNPGKNPGAPGEKPGGPGSAPGIPDDTTGNPNDGTGATPPIYQDSEEPGTPGLPTNPTPHPGGPGTGKPGGIGTVRPGGDKYSIPQMVALINKVFDIGAGIREVNENNWEGGTEGSTSIAKGTADETMLRPD